MNMQQKLRMLVLLSEMQSILLEDENDPNSAIASLQAVGIGVMGIVPPSQDKHAVNPTPHDVPQSTPNRYEAASKNWLMGE